MRRLVTAFAAASMMLAVPGVAMAATFRSPSGTTVTAPGSNVAISVSGDVTTASGNGYIDVESAPTGTVAANVPAGVTPLATFEVTAEGDVQFGELNLTFSVGTRYAGATATIYIQHGDGSTESRTVTVAADGTVTITVDRLSLFSIVVDESTIPAGNTQGSGSAAGGATGSTGVTGTKTDTSATSPDTGAFLAPVAGMTVAAVAAAGGVTVVIRRRLAE